MAEKRPVLVARAKTPWSTGWAASVLRGIASVFIIAIVFGVFLDAVIVSNTVLYTTQPYTTSQSSTVSANAVNYNSSVFTPNVLFTLSGTTLGGGGNTINWISPSKPLTVTVIGNSIATSATNALHAVPGGLDSQTFTVTNILANQPTGLTGNYYNITKVVFTLPAGLNAYNVSPSFTGTVSENYNGVPVGSYPASFTAASVNSIGTYTASAQHVGTTGSSPEAVYATLAGYLVTLANFTGIVILMVIILIVIMVIYTLFTPVSGSSAGGMGTGEGL